MTEPKPEDVEAERQKRTRYLVIGAAVSLLLPLLGVAIIKFNDFMNAAPTASGINVFNQRAIDGTAAVKVSPARVSAGPAAASALTPPPAGQASAAAPAAASAPQVQAEQAAPSGSLGFIRGGSDYYQDKQAAQPQPAKTEAPAPAPAAAPAKTSAPPPVAATASPKSFGGPRLRPTSGFSNYKTGQGLNAAPQGQPTSAPDVQGLIQGASGAGQASGPGSGANLPKMGAQRQGSLGGGGPKGGEPPAPGGGPDIEALMKGAPGGEGQPDMQEMLKKFQGGGEGGGSGGGTQDLQGMMQKYQGGASGAGVALTGGGIPNLGQGGPAGRSQNQSQGSPVEAGTDAEAPAVEKGKSKLTGQLQEPPNVSQRPRRVQ